VTKGLKGYTLNCHNCGTFITSQEKHFRCPKCGVEIQIQWPDPDFESKPQEKTITEKYEGK